MNKVMTQSYIFIAVLGLNALPIVSAQSDKSITIHQEIEFNATPQQLYNALLDSKQFSEFSGRVAEFNREVRAKATRIGNAPRVGSYRFSGGPARPFCCGMGRELLVAA